MKFEVKNIRLRDALTWLPLLGMVTILFMTLSYSNSMWIHPDSMTAAGLRFLSNGPEGFRFATYGPMAYLETGIVTAALFPIGAVLGFWNSLDTFEKTFRSNSIESLGVSFTHFSILVNFFLVLTSVFFLSMATRRQIPLRYSLALFGSLIMLLPIYLNQLTLDTIEPYVFFGMCFAIWISQEQKYRTGSPGLLDYVSVSLAFLFTIGCRINLALYIFPVFAYIGLYRAKKTRSFREIYPLILGMLMSLVSYLPLILDRDEFKTTLVMITTLSGSNPSFETLTKNLQIVFLNTGFAGGIFFLVAIFGLVLLRTPVAGSPSVTWVWMLAALTNLILFLINSNGFPKYVVPIAPVALFGAVLFFGSRGRSWPPGRFASRRIIWLSFALFVPVFCVQIMVNFHNHQSSSRFDTREVISTLIPADKSWLDTAAANATVISELTRGVNGLPFEDIIKRISVAYSSDSPCKEIMIFSSREMNFVQIGLQIEKCQSLYRDYKIFEINPYKLNNQKVEYNDWLGLLSLGTPLDSYRSGYGPIYTLVIRGESKFYKRFESGCLQQNSCSPK